VINRSEVLSYLQNMNEVEFVRLFYEAVRPRRIEYVDETDGREVVEEALVISEVIFVDAGDDSTGVQVVALPPSDYKAVSNDTLCQSGRCERCQALVVGFIKQGICPICLSEVWMT